MSPKIIVKFENIKKPSFALVDTGACTSLMNYDFYKNLVNNGLSKLRVKHSKNWPVLRGVGGQVLEILDNVRVKFQIGKIKVYQQFFVTKNVNTNILLGIDFLSQNKIVLDFSRNVLISNGYLIPLLYGNKTKIALISKNVTIRPNSINKIEIDCHNCQREVMFEMTSDTMVRRIRIQYIRIIIFLRNS